MLTLSSSLKTFLMIVLGLVVFSFVFVSTLPMDPLVRFVASEVESQTQGEFGLKIGKIEPGIFFPSILHDLQVIQNDKDNSVVWLEAKEVRLSMELLGLLFRKFEGDVSFKTATNLELRCDFEIGREKYNLDCESPEWNLVFFEPWMKGWPVQMSGKFKLDSELSWKPSAWHEVVGEIRIEPENWVLKPQGAQAEMVTGLGIELIDVVGKSSQSAIVLVFGGKKAEIKQWKLKGADLGLDFQGRIDLNTNIEQSRLNLGGSLRIMEPLEAKIGGLLSFLGKDRNDDGSIPVTFRGRLLDPQVFVAGQRLPRLW
jgi:type II secretion system protein N